MKYLILQPITNLVRKSTKRGLNGLNNLYYKVNNKNYTLNRKFENKEGADKRGQEVSEYVFKIIRKFEKIHKMLISLKLIV